MRRFSYLIASMGFVFLLLTQTAFADLSVGDSAPEFSLTSTEGAVHSLSSYKGKFVVLEWFNYDCPFVKKHYDSGNMQKLQSMYTEKGIVWLSINSSAPGKQGNYAAERMKAMASERHANSSAILLDSDGKAGRLYGAKTTPHLFVINPEGKLIYQGAIDNQASVDTADIEGAENYVAKALDEAMAGQEVTTPSTSPYGCSVKY